MCGDGFFFFFLGGGRYTAERNPRENIQSWSRSRGHCTDDIDATRDISSSLNTNTGEIDAGGEVDTPRNVSSLCTNDENDENGSWKRGT